MNTRDGFETNMYYEPDAAAAGVDRLHGLGYAPEDISVMMDDKTREKAFAALTNAKGSEGIAAGATVGGVLGAIIAGLTATGSVVAIAGTGGLAAPLVAGPLVAALAGLGAGGVAGGIIGGLIGVGVGESRAKEYEKGLANGGILVAVRPKNEEHRHQVRRALEPPSSYRGDTGETGSVDYAGEIDDRDRVRNSR